MAPPTLEDLLVAAFVVATALVAFVAVLYLKSSLPPPKHRRSDDDAPGEFEAGTMLVEEAGRVVRRSTRQHKPPGGGDVSPAPAKTPRAKAAEATPAPAARTPKTAERMTSPARGRRAAAATTPAASRARAAKSPAPTPSSPARATTPRRARATRA
ncbi:hypothetical protein HT031_005859 [Scenedesmus sp. PABB004]|nr:hypothetical protein HT031_005859 [Scenedesmus sp. PABB004]